MAAWGLLLVILVAVEALWLHRYLEPFYRQSPTPPEERVGGWLLIGGTVLFSLGILPVLLRLRGRWLLFAASTIVSAAVFLFAYATLLRW